MWVEENNFEQYVVKHAKEIVNGVINYMNSDDYNTTHWQEFVTYTANLDKIRKENLIKVEPEFKKYI
jgi:hypothetical protein